ncbi:glycogenin-2-like isoform X2 [Watersipora subatra]|uniref:glycogenin-2-like isoform X2 n=1 Tax=Watersipora subatra TaxID=2589382 RepID=UPI00355C08ED
MAVTDTIMNTAYVTLATNDTYCVGALVVASSLRLAHTSSSIVCMITPEVSQPMREILEKTFNQIYLVDVLDSHDSDNLALLDRPELGVTFTKLHCWRLEQYKKCVFLDSDTLVLANCDELFEREELSAAPDPGWPDCFNSGVFVYTPNKDTYKKLMNFAVKEGSFDGGDQGLLNLYFSDWAHADISKHLPFLYNVVSQAFYSYLPAFKRFGDKTKICHFIGPVKPWHHRFSETTGRAIEQSQTGFSSEFLQRWWEIFTTYVYPLISQSHMKAENAKEPQDGSTGYLCSNSKTLQPNYNGNTSKLSIDQSEERHPIMPSNTACGREPFSKESTVCLPACNGELLKVVIPRVVPTFIKNSVLCVDQISAQLKSTNHDASYPPSVVVAKVSGSQSPAASSSIADRLEVEPSDPVAGEEPSDMGALYELWSKYRMPYNTKSCSFESIRAHINQQLGESRPSQGFGDTPPPSPSTYGEESLMPQLAGLTLTPTDNSAVPLHTPAAGRQEDWERGVIDYRGVDSFEQIRRHIDMKLAEESPQKTKTKSLFSTTSGTPDLASKFMVSEGAEARPKVSQSADTRPKESLSADTRPKVAQDADTRPKVLPSSKPIKSVLKKT